ncbi:MAG: glycine-rich protein, partial [Bacteroidota bacterium]|nr:glycine-rich protein [Bacteroidota bacterium]
AQTFTVPPGVTSISVDAYGASGMTATSSPNYGGNTNLGKGGRVQVDLTVTPGETLNIYVGGATHMSGVYYYNGGWNGGGNGSQPGCIGMGHPGGGATDIRIGGTALTDRVIVAGGGGGRGRSSLAGGHGGGLTGQNGSGSTNSGGPAYGTGGSQSSGGIGGYAWYGDGTPTYTIPSGSNGTLGQGGSAYSQCMSAGGGGGYYGGGAGFEYGGGGGGSSYTHPTLCSSVVHTQGVRTGSGQLIITIP